MDSIGKGEVVRILARYLAAVLMAKGYLAGSEDAGLAQVLELAIGGLIAVASEAWFYFSKRVKGP